MRKIKFIVVHVSDSPDSRTDIDAAEIRRWHMNGNKWSDIGYHKVITKQGLIEEGRPEERIPSSVKGHNKYSLAVCWVGRYSINIEQLRSLRSQLQAWCLQYKLDPLKDILFHNMLDKNKSCPNLQYKPFIDFINNSNLDPQDCVKKIRIK